MYVERNVTVSSLNLSLELREPENGIPFPTLFFSQQNRLRDFNGLTFSPSC